MDGEYSIHDELDSILQDGSSEPRSLPLEYLRKITNNFADDRLLGEGGFGKVYKGVLQNGELVAVKKLDQLKLGIQQKQFENEVYHLMRLKHPNIVRFIGYCYETRNECVHHNGKYIFAEMQQKLICLEYLPNGSLDTHLYNECSGHDWRTRYKIIKGICYGLHYLHEECQCQFSASIIHLDLKPANILLDDNMGPKVADFGLSRLFEDNKSQTCATFLLGSLGYMAPEYLIGRIVTTKADIYNLGVIIIEIITGSKVNIFNFSAPTSCQDFVERVLQNWRSRLGGPPSETECKQIKGCLEIGLRCIKFDRDERPTIREIIERLGTNYDTNEDEEKPPADQTLQPNFTGAVDDDDNRTPRFYGLANWTTQVRGVFRRQLSRVMRLMRCHSSCLPMTTESSMSSENLGYGFSLGSGFALLEPEEYFFFCYEELSASEDSVCRFTLAQLEAATNGFAPEAEIGEDRFGTVYRGQLPDGGRDVVIKRGEAGRGESVFWSELTFQFRHHHKHLDGLIGYCNHNDERLLVYEYMSNGSLDGHLHPEATPSSSPSPVMSSWKLRIKILLDASRGIEYLHSDAEPPVIHGNIKSSNILLDSGWTARVSGFGLGLTLMEPEPEAEAEAQAQLTVEAAGMAGYMDPEYSLHSLTMKSDVYALGVVMLEVLTGRRAVVKEAEGSSPVSVVDYAIPSIVSGELGKILDPRAPEPAAHEAEAVGVVAYTALHCVLLKGKDRPAMAGIVASLETAFALCEGSSGCGLGHSTSSAAAPASLSPPSILRHEVELV